MDTNYFEEAYGKRRGFRRCQACKRFPGILNCYPHWLWGWLWVQGRYCDKRDPHKTWHKTPIQQIQFNGLTK